MQTFPDETSDPPADPGTYKNLGPLDVETIGSIPLERGDTGKDVIHLQLMLFELGYDFMGTATAAGASEYIDGVDGVFGPGTEAAVKLFQRDHPGGAGDRGDWEGHALRATGVVDDRTADALNRAMVGIWYANYISIDALGNSAPAPPANQLVTHDFDNPLAIPPDWYTVVIHGVPDPPPPGGHPPAGAPITRPDRSANYIPNDRGATDAAMREVHLINLHADSPTYPTFSFDSGPPNFRPVADGYPGHDDDQVNATGQLTNVHANTPLNFHTAQLHVDLNRTLRAWRTLGLRLNRWVGGTNIRVMPRQQGNPPPVTQNAWYASPSTGIAGPKPRLEFFQYQKPGSGSWVFLGDSPDIASHELGHAILDSIRPELNSSPAFEAGAFHEAFGDISAMLTALADHDVREALLNSGSFHSYLQRSSQSNLVSRLAEEFGADRFNMAIPNRTGAGLSDPNSLRDASNNFTYINPRVWDSSKNRWVNNPALPIPSATNPVAANVLAAEIHSFSRVFSGGFYDLMTLIFDRISTNIHPDDTALRRTASDAGRMLVWALTPTAHSRLPAAGDESPPTGAPAHSPKNPNIQFFRVLVEGLIRGDQALFGGTYHDDLKSAFGDSGKKTITDAAADAVH